MRITRETDYAVRCISHLSLNPGEYISVSRLSEEVGIPEKFLAKTVQKIVRAGILYSARGVNGGVRLARDPKEISILEVLEAVQGPLNVNICLEDKRVCNNSGGCAIRPIWLEIQKTISDKLRSFTFEKK